MTAAKVVLLRHGITDWNHSGRFQGQADVPLNDRGLAQAAAAAQVLADTGITRIVSSDLTRAVTTAQALAAACGLPLVTDPRLQEINVGSWVGLDNQQVAELEPTFWDDLKAGRDFRRSPTGETATETGNRVAAAIREWAEACDDDETLAIVGHGLALRVATMHLMGLEYVHSRLFAGFGNCHWAVLKPGTDYWRLISFNNAAH
ncbi:putative phosphoglycerate mutase [Propionicimonas paludicola]|uniref:Putative phosphoglycerate mutase n=1 Tax=Propionicimonas paludicola TaxID=185243 RepID=A0A2A9CNV7_9ACTN|nr:histidine phosphatase family protein [Propionicimonas paludicola]PFG16104.1 putative phosphoglycerate mutase [Propionicimonas paludicola]